MGKEEVSKILPDVGEEFEFYQYIDRNHNEKHLCCNCGRAVSDTTAYSVPDIIIFKKRGEKDNYQVQWNDSYRACFDCFEDIPQIAQEVLGKKMKRFAYLRNEHSNYRNRLTGNIDRHDAIIAFQHYVGDREKFPFAAVVDTCPICRNPIKERNIVSMNAYYLTVPVSPDVDLTGGKIRICRLCDRKRKEELIFKETSKNVHQTCSRCNEKYLITQDEKKYRDKLCIEPDFICPACTITELNFPQKLEGDVPMYMGPPERFLYFTCGCCSKTGVLDRTFSAEYITRKMVLSAREPLRLRCEVCTALKVTEDETIVDLGNDIYAALYRHPEESVALYGNVYTIENKELLEIGAIEPGKPEEIVHNLFKIKINYENVHRHKK